MFFFAVRFNSDPEYRKQILQNLVDKNPEIASTLKGCDIVRDAVQHHLQQTAPALQQPYGPPAPQSSLPQGLLDKATKSFVFHVDEVAREQFKRF